MILELVFLCLDVDIGNLTKHVWDIVSLFFCLEQEHCWPYWPIPWWWVESVAILFKTVFMLRTHSPLQVEDVPRAIFRCASGRLYLALGGLNLRFCSNGKPNHL